MSANVLNICLVEVLQIGNSDIGRESRVRICDRELREHFWYGHFALGFRGKGYVEKG